MRAAIVREPHSLRPPRPFFANAAIRPRWEGLLAFLLPFVIYLALPALTINGDGLGYYYTVLGGDWVAKLQPGHLLYSPLMTVLGRAAEAMHLLGVRQTMLLSDQLVGAAGVYLTLRVAHGLGLNRFDQWVAALGLAFSPSWRSYVGGLGCRYSSATSLGSPERSRTTMRRTKLWTWRA